MEHYKITKRKNIQQINIQDLSNEYLENIKETFSPILYVTSKNKYIGCIGWTEYNQYLKYNQVYINKSSVYLLSSENEKIKVKELFDTRPKIQCIPVLSHDGNLLYEYYCDREGFYQELELDNGIVTEKNSEKKNVVSLTSYGKRLETVYISIKSIMYQTKKADAIVLYLDEDTGNVPIKYEEELVKAGLTIRRNVKNLGPHTKYYYAMQEFKNDNIITIDDDVIYDDKLIEDLYLKHVEFPDTIICRRGHRMTISNGQLDSYDNWEYEAKSIYPSNDMCATGVGGVLYPCGMYRNACLNEKVIIDNALSADDLWLKIIELLNGVKTYVIGEISLKYIHDTQNNALHIQNVIQGQNDIILKNLQNYYSVNIVDRIK